MTIRILLVILILTSTVIWAAEKAKGDYGNFELISCESSKVYRALHIPTDKQVIVKKIPLTGFRECNLAADELLACQRVKGLAFVYSLQNQIVSEAKQWLIFDYQQGISLDYILSNQSFEEILRGIRQNIAFYAAILVLALEGIHSRGIIHNDIKVANTLLLENGFMQVIDFGLAEVSDANNENNCAIRGTPSSIAPELWAGYPRSFASDWFALGTLLWELVTGTFVFQQNIQMKAEAAGIQESQQPFSPDIHEYMKAGLNEQVIYPEDMDPRLVSFLQNLLNKDSQERWSYPNSMDSIKKHPLFAEIDFDGILKDQVKPPITIQPGFLHV